MGRWGGLKLGNAGLFRFSMVYNSKIRVISTA